LSIHWTGRPEADQLLESDPLALLIGMLLDQQVKMEKAFSGPYELRERLGGSLDAAAISAMDPDQLDGIFRERPALHRFPGSMARRVQDLCAVVARDYGNDAEAIWRDAGSGEDLAKRLRALPGFGEGKTRIMVAVLGKRFGVRPPGWEAEAADWHSIADVDSPESMAQAREVKRAMKKEAGA
jgi:uncharacterized HhH-GPD family protein